MFALARAYGIRLREVPVPDAAHSLMADVLANTNEGPAIAPELEGRGRTKASTDYDGPPTEVSPSPSPVRHIEAHDAVGAGVNLAETPPPTAAAPAQPRHGGVAGASADAQDCITAVAEESPLAWIPLGAAPRRSPRVQYHGSPQVDRELEEVHTEAPGARNASPQPESMRDRYSGSRACSLLRQEYNSSCVVV